jgi:hypothetical protein
MGLSLRELQELAEREYSIEETRKDMSRMVDWFCNLPDQEQYLDIALQKYRHIPIELGKKQKIFFVDDEMLPAHMPEEFRSESLGFVRGSHIVYAGRLVYPVMDIKGDVMGFCGWDKFTKPKYMDSHNQGYKAKATTFYGMELLPEAYRSNLPIYLTEGIVCALYLRSKGFLAFASLGSQLTPYVIAILKRFGRRLCVIPDNDTVGKSVEEINDSKRTAGEGYVTQVKRFLPQATVLQSVIAKDPDDTRLFEDGKYEQRFLYELQQVMINPFMKLETVRLR